METTNTPLGGVLVERTVADESLRSDLLTQARESSSIVLDEAALSDMTMLGNGALSPLSGFMGQADFQGVTESMRLAGGLPWTIPIVLGTDRQTAENFKEGQTIALQEPGGHLRGLLKISEIFPHDVKLHAEAVFGTRDETHPGVARVMRLGDMLLGGDVQVLNPPSTVEFSDFQFSPRQLRKEIEARDWKTVVAFQTRNPLHRAHEYLMKCALESTDGLVLHPLVGQTKSDDLSAEVRMKSYQVLLQNYFNPSHTMLAVLPAAMRYAGPREAVFHAILRKNYGCTHFIVGRDHAGVSRPDGTSYYGSFDAHKIFDNFQAGEIGINLLRYDHSFYCRHCAAIVTEKTAPTNNPERFTLSGTYIRELLRSGQRPPPEIMRPEVADILIQALADEQRVSEITLGRGI